MNVVLRLASLAGAILLNFGVVSGADSGIQCPLAGPAPPATCDGSDGVWFPVSVEGSKTFCALGPEICVADIFAACPGPSLGLPFGSKCTQLKTNVYGCVPKTSCTDGDLDAVSSDATCERGCSIDSSIPKQCDGSNGWTPVSVVNSSTFCTAGAVCVADTANACPGPQPGLPFGSSCVKIPSGVFGCVRNQQCQKGCDNATAASTPTPTPASTTPVPLSPAPTPASTTSTPATPAPTTPAPVTTTPAATTTSTPTTTVPSTTTPLVTATLPPPTTMPPQSTTPPSTTAPPADTTNTPVDDLTATVAPDLVDSNTDLLPVPDPNSDLTLDELPNLESRRLVQSSTAAFSPKESLCVLALVVAAMLVAA